MSWKRINKSDRKRKAAADRSIAQRREAIIDKYNEKDSEKGFYWGVSLSKLSELANLDMERATYSIFNTGFITPKSKKILTLR